MTKRQARSSRKRMAGRIRRRFRQEPTPYVLMKVRIPLNRARRRQDVRHAKKVASESVRDQVKKKRQRRLVKARLVLKKIRTATRRAMRRATGVLR